MIAPNEQLCLSAARILQSGGVIALPTETVYGLAGDITNEDAIRRIYAIKRRPLNHPLIVHIGRIEDLSRYALDPPDIAWKLAERYWPGPLTLVLRKTAAVPESVTGNQQTVAIRMVDHPVTSRIMRAFGGAFAGPSANRFGRLSPTTAGHVRDDLGSDVDLIVDGGPARIGIESTIVDLATDVPAVLRAGAIEASALGSVLGRDIAFRERSTTRVPGTLRSHYAPRALLILTTERELETKLSQFTQRGLHAGTLRLDADPAIAARSLYGTLREFDNAGFEVIVVIRPPDDEAHAAVLDRLCRAAAPRETASLEGPH